MVVSTEMLMCDVYAYLLIFLQTVHPWGMPQGSALEPLLPCVCYATLVISFSLRAINTFNMMMTLGLVSLARTSSMNSIFVDPAASSTSLLGCVQ